MDSTGVAESSSFQVSTVELHTLLEDGHGAGILG
jgi:hypothetical protein